MNPPLHSIRAQLDAVDKQLVAQLAARQHLISQVAASKAADDSLLRDNPREEAILQRVAELGRAQGLDGWYVSRLYRTILDHSVHLQEAHLVARDNPEQVPVQVVGYQGTAGSYSRMAARKHFASRGPATEYRGYNTFAEVLQALEAGALSHAVLPIENTTAGSINATYDLLAETHDAIVGEVVQKIEHCLLAPQQVPLSHIRRIFSQAPALDQCSRFLAELTDCDVQSFTDTAMAVRKVAEEQDLSQAAIGSEEAGRLYGLQILKREIANQRENYTRFVVVARETPVIDTRIPCKTSLLLATRHEHGALLRCLNILERHALNLCKLESRPRRNTPWQYRFYVDIEANLAEPRVEQALRELAAHTCVLKVLGCYPRRTSSAADAEAPACAAVPQKAPAPVQTVEPDILSLLEKKPYRLASRVGRSDDTVIRIGNVTLGGGQPVVIAGPCSVESAEQVRSTARWVREYGAHILRGGCFKPRTSPYSFQGLGYDGLDLLAQAGREMAMPIITEVMHPADVAGVAAQADVLQIGARNMQNFALLQEVGRCQRPVMLKRGMMASIDEWLSAAEYILARGNQQVILCERGIRTFETATRNTLDLSAIPVLRERSHLPIIVDPSHAVGNRRWVIPMVRAAIAAGADGVMVEVHPEPEKALSDGPQALTFEMFRGLMEQLAESRSGAAVTS